MNREIEQEKAFNNLVDSFKKGCKRLLLKATVRFGKSKVAADFIKEIGFNNILIVIPKITNIAQWKVELEKFGISQKIDFITYRSLHKLDYLPDLMILDEIQNITEKGFNKELFEQIPLILGLTGTLPKNKTKKEILNEIKFEIPYGIEANEAIDLNIISNFKIKVIYTSLDFEKNLEVIGKKITFKTSEYLSYEYRCKQIAMSSDPLNLIRRANFIYGLKSKIKPTLSLISQLNPNSKTLIFTKRTEIADILCENSIHSKKTKEDNIELLEKFRLGEIKTLSTVEQIKEGVTIPDIDNIIIQQLDSNPGNLIQRIGRGLLYKENHIVKVFLVICKNTIEEEWLQKALPKEIQVEYFIYDKFLKNFKKI